MNSDKIDFSGEAANVIDTVEAVHPIFKIDGMLPDYYEEYKNEYTAIAAAPITRTEFVLATQHYFTALLDGHMGFGLREKVDAKERRYQDGRMIPVSFTAKNSRLFLTDKPDTEVIKISGAAVADIFAQIDRYYYPENQSARMQKYEQHAILMIDSICHVGDAPLRVPFKLEPRKNQTRLPVGRQAERAGARSLQTAFGKSIRLWV
jgi:hypothetical protein